MDRYKLLDSFPSSLPKYQVSVIYDSIKGYTEYNPCRKMYNQEDTRNNMSYDEIVEDLAFNETQKTMFFLDVKKRRLNTRRVDEMKLSKYLKQQFNYDATRISDFRDDKNALFIMMFYEIYNRDENTIDDRLLREARAASYKFRDKRDRMAVIEEDIDDVDLSLDEFENVMKSDGRLTKTTVYQSNNSETIILMSQEDSRELIPVFSGEDLSIKHMNLNPIRENAVKISSHSKGVKVQSYSSVSNWEDTFGYFFNTVFGNNYTSEMKAKNSERAREILKDVQESSSDDSVEDDVAGHDVPDVVMDNIQQGTTDVEEEETDVSQEYVDMCANKMKITGIEIDSDSTTFEIHSDNGISSLLDSYDGMAETLAKSIRDAQTEDIVIETSLPSSDSSENHSVKLEEGEWYVSSNGDDSVIEALEVIL